MDSTDVLKLISLMRHDFLNHLQVISGYVQLNKTERAREYIREVTGNLQRLSKVVHLKVPEMAAAFLLGEEMAAGMEIRTIYNVESDLEGCAVPGPVAGRALYAVLQEVFRAIDAGGREERSSLVIDILGNGENCGCTLKFRVGEGLDDIDEKVGRIDRRLREYGGRLNWTMDSESGECRLEMILPCS